MRRDQGAGLAAEVVAEALAKVRAERRGGPERDRRGTLIFQQNKASVLREKDIMQLEEAKTPVGRIYFPVMMMYLDEANAQKYYDEMARRLDGVHDRHAQPECAHRVRQCSPSTFWKMNTTRR